MPQVLTTNAQVHCPHGGVGTSVSTTRKVAVNGGDVLVAGDTGLLGCVFIPPCVGYTLRSMGLNASFIDGRPIILVTDFNQSQTGLPLTITETHSVYDDSTPAPIPQGQAAPPPSPALADIIPPIVIAAPPVLAFNATTQLPPGAAVTFTLTSDHPLKWVLILLNEPASTSVDLTSAVLPGLTVAPSGGGWSTPSLTVSVALTSPFMTALGVGRHHFYMTAVSERGLFGDAEAVLTVS